MIVNIQAMPGEELRNCIGRALYINQVNGVDGLNLEHDSRIVTIIDGDTLDSVLNKFEHYVNLFDNVGIKSYGAMLSSPIPPELSNYNRKETLDSLMSMHEAERVRTLEIVRKFIKDELDITVECVENRVGVYLRLGKENFSDDFDYIV